MLTGFTFRRRDRREFPRKVKLIAFQRCHGKCEKCEVPLSVGHFIYDHIIAWELSRDSSVDNCQVVCSNCDAPKTAKDQTVIAKSNRVRDNHIGARNPSRHPLPGSRRSPFKMKIGGGVVDRKTGQPWHWGRGRA